MLDRVVTLLEREKHPAQQEGALTGASESSELNTLRLFSQNAQLLRRKASRHAWIGMTIGVAAVLVATACLAYLERGTITATGLLAAQNRNPSLWLVNAMPFVFAFWGQYVSVVMSYEAGAMVVDQTSQLRARNEALEQQSQYSAMYDTLTGLPNWVLLLDRLKHALRLARCEERPLGVIRLALDRFKEINDSVGYYNGDRVLKEVAHRIQEQLEEPDTLARPGGADFAIVLTKLTSTEEGTRILNQISQALDEPVVVEEVKLKVQPRMGIAFFPDHGIDPDSLLQRAETAMAAARNKPQRVVHYSPELEAQIA